MGLTSFANRNYKLKHQEARLSSLGVLFEVQPLRLNTILARTGLLGIWCDLRRRGLPRCVRPLAATAGRRSCRRRVHQGALAFGQLLATLPRSQSSLRRLPDRTPFREYRWPSSSQPVAPTLRYRTEVCLKKALGPRHALSRLVTLLSDNVKKSSLRFPFLHFLSRPVTPRHAPVPVWSQPHRQLLLILQALIANWKLQMNKTTTAVRSGA